MKKISKIGHQSLKNLTSFSPINYSCNFATQKFYSTQQSSTMPSYFDQLPKESFENSTRHYFKSPLTFSSTQPSSADESSTLGIMITQQVTGSIITIDDEECIVFYQAYNSGIADWVVKNQTFDECPNFDKKRMSWIKPNYLWMMYRSEYATAKNQTNILALFITRKSFEEELLKHAVCAMYYPELEGYYKSQKEWKVNCSQMKEKVAQLMNKNDTDTIMTDNVCFARVQVCFRILYLILIFF